jgi:phosphoserine phosphatase
VAELAAIATESADVVVFDLDGTLIVGHTLELLRNRAAEDPVVFARWQKSVGVSKQEEKVVLHEELGLDVTALHYRSEVTQLVRALGSTPCRVVLATGSSHQLAKDIAAHLTGFDAVLGSTRETNLTGPRKAAALRAEFPNERMWYVGDSPADVDVWRQADGGVVVGGTIPEWMPEDLRRKIWGLDPEGPTAGWEVVR